MFEKRIRPNDPDCRVVVEQPEQTGVLIQPEQTGTGNPDTNLQIQEALQTHRQGLERLHRELSGGNQPQGEELGEGDPEKEKGIQETTLSRRDFIKLLGSGFVSCFIPPYPDANNKGRILNPSPPPKKSSGGSSRLADVQGEQSRAVNPDTTNLPTQSTQSARQRHTESLQQLRRSATIEENDPKKEIPIEDLLLEVGWIASYVLFLLSLIEVLPRIYFKLDRLLRFPHSFDKIVVGKNQITVFLDQKPQKVNREETELDGIKRDLREACNFLPESFLSGTKAFSLETRHSNNYSGKADPAGNNVVLNVNSSSGHKDFLSTISTIFHELTHTIAHRYKFYLIFAFNLVNMRFNLKILNRDELRTWLEISRNNGGYLSNSPIENWDLVKPKTNKKGFGFVYDETEYRYGSLSLEEDIACVFEQILTKVYFTFEYIEYNPNISEDEKKIKAVNMAKALMELTPEDVDLWRKYVIACNILIRMYEKELKQKQKQERARALGGRDQLDSRIQLITEIIGILRIFRATFDHDITLHTLKTQD